jgi:hypothetical protein
MNAPAAPAKRKSTQHPIDDRCTEGAPHGWLIKSCGIVIGSTTQETSDSMVMSTQPSPTSRSSPTKVRAMVDSLDAFKKSLVEEMEFGGILHVPIIYRTNLKLSIWLMSRVDEVSRTIYIRPGRQMSFRASDVHKVFGVPCGRVCIYRKHPH